MNFRPYGDRFSSRVNIVTFLAFSNSLCFKQLDVITGTYVLVKENKGGFAHVQMDCNHPYTPEKLNNDGYDQ